MTSGATGVSAKATNSSEHERFLTAICKTHVWIKEKPESVIMVFCDFSLNVCLLFFLF